MSIGSSGFGSFNFSFAYISVGCKVIFSLNYGEFPSGIGLGFDASFCFLKFGGCGYCGVGLLAPSFYFSNLSFDG